MDTLRESFAGQVIRAITGSRLLPYPDELPDYVLPNRYRFHEKTTQDAPSDSQRPSDHPFHERNLAPGENAEQHGRLSTTSDNSDTTLVVDERLVTRQGGQGIPPDKIKELMGKSEIVTWYGPEDPENPLNWSLFKKCWLVAIIMLMTSSVYMGSSIWSPAVMEGAQYFGVGQVTSTLGLSLFVVGYGVGPLFLSPLTEIPAIGRTIPYIITLALYCILQVPTALVTNFAGFAVLRFLAGFWGSPPLATGGATIQDVFAAHTTPYAMGLWGLSAGASPALAPIIAGFAVEAKGWRWSFWEMLWLSGFTLSLAIFLLPETSAGTILLRRAKRLRKLTGNDQLKSISEISSEQMTGGEIVKMTLIRPFSMTFTEPIVLAIDLYIGLIYAILYSYFESYPIVYAEGYGWSLGVSNLPFAALLVGALLSYAGYCIWNKLYFEKVYTETRHQAPPEARLPMSMAAAICFPVSLFWFAWSANRTHWIAPVISAVFFGMGTTWMFMPFLTYLPHAYPEYAASVLASNDFFRSMMGAGMPLAAHGLFVNLGIDWGNTLLAFLTVLFVPIPFVLYKAGPWLRKKSPRALHDDEEKKGDDEQA
ncbi:uncharacterized protein I303_107540 [Kwoniella dejecticola CBS 10117]|uniref:Major facilitator superfamily (MFS) profile domain-containing protein n=1 Tax=Kwoniella dejecticola CBS 10117 TaxID=1296121 RepID=A0A1A5ZZY4_9TREE|nr:uncharacterized protein I303_06945 [Kwoniella dejecticola CBS 10117]OBR83380.1 hypothetical protein I303_06945 [Kwoniella dejecticola CBS 10117]